MIIWILLQLRGRIFEPLGTDLTARFVHWHRELFVFCFCGVFWCSRSLWTSGWDANSNSGCPMQRKEFCRMNNCTSKPWGCACSQVGMGGKSPKWEEKPLTPGGAPCRGKDTGAWWLLRAWSAGEFSVLPAREGGFPTLLFQRTAVAFCILWVRGNCWTWEGWLQTLFFSHT